MPLAFLAIHLANRRYGPSVAFWQIVISFVVLGLFVCFARELVRSLLPERNLPGGREAAAFGLAFAVAGLLSIVAFDAARGPRWWSAPLSGSIVGALVYAPIFYPAAYFGTALPWFEQMTTHAGILVAGAVLVLFPYWLLRRLVQPLAGYGG